MASIGNAQNLPTSKNSAKKNTQSDAQIPSSDFAGLRETDIGIVSDIIDPLTIKLKNGDIIHLTGLDYPDLDYYSPGNFSLLATKILKDMLIGKKVKLYQSTNLSALENRMGHRIAQLERTDDGLWVQGTLLSLGLARVRTTISNSELSDQMLSFEKQARDEKIGLWSTMFYGIHEVNDADRYIGSYQIIEGKVQNVSLKENRVFINFGANWRSDFTASITPTSRRAFIKAGFDFQNMGGQRIRMRGWVSSYNGPYIEITHPAQIEIVSPPKLEIPTEGLKKSPSSTQKGDALPNVELSGQPEEPDERQTKKSVTMGDSTILKRATSMNK